MDPSQTKLCDCCNQRSNDLQIEPITLCLGARHLADMTTMNIEGIRVGYRDEGSDLAPTALLIHGAGATKDTNWEGVFDALRGRARVVAFDLPGSGETPPRTERLTPEMLANLATTVIDELRIQRVHVVGYSLGGAIASIFAAMRPERTHALTLLAPVLHADTRARFMFDTWRRLFARDAELFVRHALLTGTANHTFASMNEEQLAHLVSAFTAMTPVGLGAQAELLTRLDVRPYLARIEAPTRVIGFTLDQQVPVEQARKLAESIAGAELRERPWAHLAPWQEPDAFVEEIVDHVMAGVR